MRFLRIPAACLLWAVGLASAGHATTVNFSGTVSYTGLYAADTLYCAVLDTTGSGDGAPTLVTYQALPVGSTPFAVPFSLDFDNAGLGAFLWLASLLDVDHTGFDPDSLDNVATNADVVGWYDGHPEPMLVSSATSHSGLDFALPTARIMGNVVFAAAQTQVEIQAASVPDYFNAHSIRLSASGAYVLPDVYAGDWIVPRS